MAEVLVWVDIFICWLVGRAGCVYLKPSSINGCNTWLAILANVHRVTSLTWLVRLQQQKSSLSWYFRLLISHPIQFEWKNSIFKFVSWSLQWRATEVIQYFMFKFSFAGELDVFTRSQAGVLRSSGRSGNGSERSLTEEEAITIGWISVLAKKKTDWENQTDRR